VSRSVERRPDPTELLRQISSETRRRASFRVYLGYARGCGTTTSMLDEARRRQSRGTDVVVAAYEIHDPPSKALSALEVIQATKEMPRVRRLDLGAVLARNPEVVCIDDVMAPDVTGRPAFESVPRQLSAGITVLATLHLLSLRSAATAVAGMLAERVPEPLVGDDFFNQIDEIEYVDITPEDLLARIKERSILTPAELAVAMQRELRPAVLAILRETALRMTAEHMDRQLPRYLPAGQPPLEFRGRIVLAIPVAPAMEDRIRTIARYAASQGSKLSVVTVRTHQLRDDEKSWLGAYASLVHQLGGEFARLEGRNVAKAVVRYVREAQATEVVLGHRRHARRLPWDTTSEIIRMLSGVDVHILRARQPANSMAPTA
jgi:two-component system, OmpR family, sensor histidine kinase KdpD